MQRLRTFWPLLVVDLAVAANVVILANLPLLLQGAAILLLAGLLPGALLVELLVGRCDATPTRWERALYSIGVGYSCITLVMLGLSYLPGGMGRWQTLLAFNLLLLILLLLNLRPAKRSANRPGLPENETPVSALTARVTWVNHRSRAKRHWQYIGMVVLLLVGGYFRFANLGYSEFQGDEARLALRAAEVIQGYENALFVHKKGPVEILLPTAFYVLSSHLTESTARLPFAFANLAGLFAIFLLGRRLYNPTTGWIAAMLLALDGYILGFGRVVQYQSIVFLMVGLVAILLHRLTRSVRGLGNYLLLAALFLATGLLAHYEAALVLIPGSYLLWRIWRQGTPLAQLSRAALLPALVGGGIVASFYLPFVRNPSFGDTYAYLTDYRMGGGSVFNHLAEFFARTTVYSSTYYLVSLIGLSALGLLKLYWQNLRSPWRWLVVSAITLGLLLTFWSSTWLTIGGLDCTWLFFAGVLVGAWLLPKFPPDERMVWLWFGAVMLLALFFTAIPNTHVYSFFIPWALLTGAVANRGRRVIFSHFPRRFAQTIAMTIATGVVLLFGFYEYELFVYNKVEVLRTWPVNHPPGYWVNYTMPVDVAIFGFPLNNGWKAVAGLYAEGVLRGNYDTNGRDVVADWYTRGQGRCARDDANYYILVNPVEPGLADETAQLRKRVEQERKLFGTVYVRGRAALTIYQQTTARLTPQSFNEEAFAARFDHELSTPDLERNGPVAPRPIPHPVAFRLGEAIQLKGYRLDTTQVQRGATFPLTLYWQATQRLQQDYTVFVQVIDLHDLRKAGQRDGQPGCNSAPTTTWLPGDLIADHYTIPLAADVQPGSYTLLIGMTLGDQRLEVYDATGQSVGNQLALTTIDLQR